MWLERIAHRPELVIPVALGMREWDKREAYALRFDDDPLHLASEAAILGSNIGWVAGLDAPIAAFGCHLMWPGVFSMWLIATDGFQQIGLSVTKLVKRQIVPMLWQAGAHRLEARSMEGHTDAQRWLHTIGARREATLKGYGRGGEDFDVFTWDRP